MAQIISKNTFSSSEFIPEWLGASLDSDHSLPGGVILDEAQFQAEDAVLVTVGAAALAAATSITVTALSGPIPDNTLLDFGTNKFARLNGAADEGDTALTVDAIPTALAGGETYTYPGVMGVVVPSGTVIGRTYTERDAGTNFGPAASGDEEVYIVLHDVEFEISGGEAAVLYEGLIYENNMPNWSALTSAVKALVRARFKTSVAQD